jgi:DNA adenine methylase
MAKTTSTPKDKHEKEQSHFAARSHLSVEMALNGGKQYLARRIIDRFPKHNHFVEPFAGGLAVLLERDPEDERFWLPPHKGVSEVVNDINHRLINFWRVLQHDDWFSEFRRKVEAIPMSREVWNLAHKDLDPGCVDDAVNFFVDCRQSLAGRMKSFTAITRSRTRRGMNGNVSEWIGAVDGLPAVHARLRRVLIECMPAIDLIKREDTLGTLQYLDCPYLPETRTAKKVYEHEMTYEEHEELLDVITQCKGKIMISGYKSPLYELKLHDWERRDWDLPNNASGSTSKRRMIESLWMNF